MPLQAVSRLCGEQVVRKLLALGIFTVWGALVGGAAQAATIGFAPSDIAVGAGDLFTVDVVVSDLGGEIVSAYDLDITFDGAALQANFVTFTNGLGNISLEAIIDASLSTGVLDVAALSLLSDASLLALQGGDSIALFTVGFTALAEGTTTLGLLANQPGNPASGPNDPMDLDGDGAITVIDSRAAVRLCTFPNCDQGGGGSIPFGDIDEDGDVDEDDVDAIFENRGGNAVVGSRDGPLAPELFDGTVRVGNPVPEPSAALLFGIGLPILATRLRRRH
jgi:hypothetical protein